MRLFSIIVTSAVFILIIFLATAKIGDPDTPQYLASGKYITLNGLPKSCVYTYTLTRCITVYSEWLLHLITYGVFLVSGWNGLSIFLTVTVTLVFLTILTFNYKKKVNPVIISSIMFPAALAASGRFVLRADTVALLPMTLYFVCLEYFRRGIKGDINKGSRRKLLIILFMIQLFWTNIHGSFPIAFLMILAFASRDLLKIILSFFANEKPGKETLEWLKELAVISCITLLASLLNPYGWRAFLWPFANTADTIGKSLVTTISEYKSPWQPRDFELLFFKVYKLLSYLTPAVILFQIRRVRLNHLVILGLTFLLSLAGIRYMSVFAVFAAFILPEYAENSLKTIIRFVFKKKPAGRVFTYLIFVLGISVTYLCLKYSADIRDNSYYMKMALSRRFGVGMGYLDYPEKALQFIRENKIRGEMFNSYKYGGYLNFRLFPIYRTFVHGAVLDFDITDSVWLYRYYLQVISGEVSYSEAALRYGINFFVLNHLFDPDSFLVADLYRDPEWVLVYLDEITAVFVANKAENAEIIAKNNLEKQKDRDIPNRDFVNSLADYDKAALYNSMGNFYARLKMFDKASAAHEASLNAYKTFIAYGNLAGIYEETGQKEKAEEYYKKAIKLEDNYASLHFNYGKFLAGERRFSEALVEFEKTLAINKSHKQAKLAIASLAQAKK